MSDFLSLYDESDDYQPSKEESSPLCEQLAKVTDAYSKEELIAKGGMKSISKVYCERTHRYVAKATLNQADNLEFREAFIREARLTALLDHPNIIKIYDIALSEKGEPFFTMELKTGSSLRLFLKQEQSRSELLEIFIKICDAIAYAHSRRVLHLDIKPDNIQVGSFGEVIVCDWGLGRIITNQDKKGYATGLELEADILNHCTLYGEAKGTPGYMAPEQLDGQDKNEQTDIYALGALLFTLLVPDRLNEKTTEKLLTETREGTPSTEILQATEIPDSLKAVISKAMAPTSEERYSSVEALQKDVRLFLNEYPTEAQEADFWIQSSFFWRRNQRICQTILASVIIVIGGLLFFLNQLTQSERRTAQALLESEQHAADLEKTMKMNKTMAKSLDTLPKTIVSRIFAENQQYRDYQLLMTPEVSLERSNQYLEAAYKTEAENKYIIGALAANYFIGMYFDKLKPLAEQHPKHLHFYIDFFSKVSEGLLEEKGFETYKTIAKYASKNPVFMELVIAYHAERFRPNGEFPALIEALIKKYYPKNQKLDLTLRGNSLEIWAPDLNEMTSPVTKLCLLRYLKFKDLFVAKNSISNAKEFAGLNLRRLYLQHTQITDLLPLLSITTLDRVTIQHDQIPQEQLAEFSKHFSKDLVQVYEAEDAIHTHKVKANYNHRNYTSGGFVDGFYKNPNGIISFELEAKQTAAETIRFRYSAGFGDAEIIIITNNQEKEFTLKSTGTWEQWQTVQIPIDLKQGNNLLSFKMKTSTHKCFNLDSISRPVVLGSRLKKY